MLFVGVLLGRIREDGRVAVAMEDPGRVAFGCQGCHEELGAGAFILVLVW